MATTTVNLDGLRELAAFRAQNGCAISLYLDLDPAVSPTARHTSARVNALLDTAAKSHGATRPDLSHEVRAGLKADFERLQHFFDGEFNRDGAHGPSHRQHGEPAWGLRISGLSDRRSLRRRQEVHRRLIKGICDRSGCGLAGWWLCKSSRRWRWPI